MQRIKLMRLNAINAHTENEITQQKRYVPYGLKETKLSPV